MKTLKEVKSIIFKTECKNLIFDGLSRSEPILTLGDEGIIDNYFVYATNKDNTMVSEPMVVFGIYSELEKTAFINPNIYNPNAENMSNEVNRNIITADYINEYEKLYERIRGFAFQDCSEEEKSVLEDYLVHLRNLSGTGLWNNYEKIAPQFFDWVRKEEISI